MRRSAANHGIGSLATVILVLALLHFAQTIFVPLFFALFIIALVWPLQAALQRLLPRLLALLITLTATVTAVVALGSAVAWGLARLGQWLLVNASRFQAIYIQTITWLEDHGIGVVGPLTDRFDVNWLVGFMQGLAGRLNGYLGFALLVFIFVMLGLLEVEDFNSRLLAPAAQPHGAKIRAANHEIGGKLRRFMLVRSFVSVLTGLVVWAFALSTGLELAAAWGVIAFALNFIPFIGPFIATAFPALFAIAQFESWRMALTVYLGLTLIQFVIGSYLEPRLAGASLSVSPFAVVFAIFFWTFMWGISGAFIGVPILIAFSVLCTRWPSGRWLASLLGAKLPEA